jgi:hypothetical protein
LVGRKHALSQGGSCLCHAEEHNRLRQIGAELGGERVHSFAHCGWARWDVTTQDL